MKAAALGQFVSEAAFRVRAGDAELDEVYAQFVLGHPVVSAQQPFLELFAGQHSVLFLPKLVALRTA